MVAGVCCRLSSFVIVCNTGACNVTHQETSLDSRLVVLRPVIRRQLVLVYHFIVVSYLFVPNHSKSLEDKVRNNSKKTVYYKVHDRKLIHLQREF